MSTNSTQSTNQISSRNRLRIICESGVMLALAAVLSLIQLWHSPYGGSVTLLSMLPIVIISMRHGVKIGLSVSFIYSLIQIGIDLAKLMGYGMTVDTWIGSLLFDYIFAFTALGLAGLWRKHGIWAQVGGTAFVIFLRFCSHVVSGYIFFGVFAPEGWNPLLYSLFYNAVYMIPELISTVVAAFIIFRLKVFSRILTVRNQ